MSVRSRCASTVRKVSRIKAVRVTGACLWLAVSAFAGFVTGGVLVLAAGHFQAPLSGWPGVAGRLGIADIAVLTLVVLDGLPPVWLRYHTRGVS